MSTTGVTSLGEVADGPELAHSAGLTYTSDALPGIRRRRSGKGFSYRGPDGEPVDAETCRRIKALAIPPAWKDVWICPDPRGHLQATGLDQRGRKQYRYHAGWRAVRDAVKYDHMVGFGEALPQIRARVEKDLRHAGLPREKVVAAVVQIMDETGIRVGNDVYRRENNSFGLTTLRNRHVRYFGQGVRFEFVGKSGKKQSVEVHSRRLARLVRQCQELPGYELFQYLDADGQHHQVRSDDVNSYLKEVTGEDFTAKDFRTWNGSVAALRCLRESESCSSETQGRHVVVTAMKAVAALLGNTPAVCRSSYVHPEVIRAYLGGRLRPAEPRAQAHLPPAASALHEDEQALLLLLKDAQCQGGVEQALEASLSAARAAGHAA